MQNQLKQLLTEEIKLIEGRIKMLETNKEYYLEQNLLMDAAINKIKIVTLESVHERLVSLLETPL